MKTSTLILIAGLGISSSSFAVDPPPDGGYENENTAEGEDALFSLTTGAGNTALGFQALYFSTVGSSNTAIGASALHANTTGYSNTATGFVSLYKNTLGSQNTATGSGALYNNTTGQGNTADGVSALFSNTTGLQNAAFGASALPNNTTGALNTAVGTAALYFSKLGSVNIAVGYNAGSHIVSGSNNIDIGGKGTVDESGVIRIGNQGTQTAAYIAGISDTPLTVGTAVAVGVTPAGQLGVRASSAKFKEGIKPMENASEAILLLQPVTFHYKKVLDPKATPQFGLVAEQVEKVDPDLVVKDDEGKPFSVRYEAVNAMLLNEFLKEHNKVEEQTKAVEKQAAKVDAQAKEIAELKSALKEVTDRLTAKGL